MRIGIDIDDTLTDIKDKINISAYQYALKLNKKVSFYNKEIDSYEDLYKKHYKLTDEEILFFISNIHEQITSEVLPREGAREIIGKLKSDGHTIFIITSRSFKYHTDPYMLSKNWLDRNNIKYDKLIVNAVDKVEVCKEEKIDVFIDDILDNCIRLSENGIFTINISTTNRGFENIITTNDWYNIYEIITNFNNGNVRREYEK